MRVKMYNPINDKEWLHLIDQYIFAVQTNKMGAQEAFELLSKQRLAYLSERLLEAFKASKSNPVKDD